MEYKCVVCQKSITVSYFVCAACATDNGGTYKDFPEWLRELVRMERRERYRSRRDAEKEVPLDDAESRYYVMPWDKDRFS